MLELYRAAKADPELFLSYSRRKEEYGRAGDHPLATLTTVTGVVVFLEGAGYATARSGSYSRRPNPFVPGEIGSGYLSRIRAEPLLVEMLEGVFGVALAGIGAAKDTTGRLIRLKAPKVCRGLMLRPLPCLL